MKDLNKILVIGCPGSGKSTLAKRLAKRLGYPLLHLDVIYHIDNETQISKELLESKIRTFCESNDHFIIDGNYSSTLALRMSYADTIVFFDIDPEICLANVYKRIENNEPRDDIAPGFDNSITDPEFIKYVQNFKTLRQPLIEKMVSSFKGTMVRLNHYDEAERFIENLPNIQAKQ